MPIIATERLVLRWLTEDDAAFILELTNDPDWLRFIGDRGIRTLDDARRYIETGPGWSYGHFGFGLYAVELYEGGPPIGICGLIQRDWLEAPDLGFAFLPAHRGKGYAREAAAGTLAYAREPLGINDVLAIVSPENAASIRLLEDLGMRFERTAAPPGDAREIRVYTTASPIGPMSPNKQTVTRYLDAFGNQDHAAVLDCLTDDVEWVIPGVAHLHGKAEFEGGIENPAFLGSPLLTVKRLVEDSGVVVAEGRVEAMRRKGPNLDAAFCDVCVMREKKIARLTSYLMELPEDWGSWPG